MGLTINAPTPVDDTFLSTAIASSATVILKTYNGDGAVTIAIRGNGTKQVNIQYSVDGGAFVTLSAANVKSVTSIAFGISLVVQNVNTVASSQTTSDVSVTGLVNS